MSNFLKPPKTRIIEELRERCARLARENAELQKTIGAHHRVSDGALAIPCMVCKEPTPEWCTTCWGAVCTTCQEGHAVLCVSELRSLREELPRVRGFLDAADAHAKTIGEQRIRFANALAELGLRSEELLGQELAERLCALVAGIGGYGERTSDRDEVQEGIRALVRWAGGVGELAELALDTSRELSTPLVDAHRAQSGGAS